MIRKIVSCILILSSLSYIGCYNTISLTKKEAQQKESKVPITVLMKDGSRYEFEADKYTVSTDSLGGIGLRRTDDSYVVAPFQGSLPLAEVASIEVTELSSSKTIGLVVATGVVIAVITVLVVINNIRLNM